EAAYGPERRLGRHRRLLPGADRLDRSPRLTVVGAGRVVPGRLLLDATAHVDPRDALPRRLRGRRCAHAAGGRRRTAGDPPDRVVLLGDRCGLAGSVADRRHRWVLPSGGRAARRRGDGRGIRSADPRSAGRYRAGTEADAGLPLVEPLPRAVVRCGRDRPAVVRLTRASGGRPGTARPLTTPRARTRRNRRREPPPACADQPASAMAGRTGRRRPPVRRALRRAAGTTRAGRTPRRRPLARR